MLKFRIAISIVAAVLSVSAQTPQYGYQVVHVYPHDPNAFTQGLEYRAGSLYESTGLKGRSSVRKVQLDSGKVLQQIDIDAQYFGARGSTGDLKDAREDEVPGQGCRSDAHLERPRRWALPLAPRLERLAEACHLQLAGLEVGLDEEREELVVLPPEEEVRQAQIREKRVRDRAHDAVDGGGRLGVDEEVGASQAVDGAEEEVSRASWRRRRTRRR